MAASADQLKYFNVSAALVCAFGVGLTLAPGIFIQLYNSSPAPEAGVLSAWQRAFGGDLVLFGGLIGFSARYAHPKKIVGLRKVVGGLFAECF